MQDRQADLFPSRPPDLIPGQRLTGRVAGVFVVAEGNVEATAAPSLAVDIDGVEGDRHFGVTRHATSREPWYPRGAVIANTRQVTLVSVEELAEVAGLLGVPALQAEWLGANVLVEGIARLTYLPAGTRLHFPNRAALMVTGPNTPCRVAGRAVAAHFPGRTDLELGFAEKAQWRRGLIAQVEAPGRIAPGDTVSVRIPEQWIYRKDPGA
jgi:hypothetical protein